MKIIYKWDILCEKEDQSQTSDLWTNAATVVRAVREEKGSEEKESVERRAR